MVALSWVELKKELKEFVTEMADDLIMELRDNRKKDSILDWISWDVSKKEMYV